LASCSHLAVVVAAADGKVFVDDDVLATLPHWPGPTVEDAVGKIHRCAMAVAEPASCTFACSARKKTAMTGPNWL
jgi:hypothetical protein